MKPFTRRPEVEADLARYARHIARDNEVAAEAFVTAAETAFRRLAHFPSLGRRRRWQNPRLAGLRSRPLARPFAAWLVFYRETTHAIEIVRVLHGTMNLGSRLLEPPEK